MSIKTLNPIAATVGAVMIGSLSTLAVAAENPFSAAKLDGGYMQLADSHTAGKCGEGKCGGEKKAEGKCGEGKCGGDKAKAEGKCGEGKCGADKAKKEGKCGEGKCGGDKKSSMEGKCGGH